MACTHAYMHAISCVSHMCKGAQASTYLMHHVCCCFIACYVRAGGGPLCASYPGGANQCCASGVRATYNRACKNYPAPCLFNIATAPVPAPVPAPAPRPVAPVPQPVATGCQPQWQQCAGIGFGTKCCVAGTACKYLNDYYSQCQ